MKLKIYQEKVKKEKTVFLALITTSNGIEVIAYDDNQEQYAGGYLIRFNPDGTIFRFGGVNQDIGFQLNQNGQIILENDTT